MAIIEAIIGFVISLIISSVVIYLVASKIFNETEGFSTALQAALIGAVIYALAYFFLANGFVASILGGIAWLIALGSLYRIGWAKSLLIAVVVWVITTVISHFLPTVTGPL